MEDGYDADDLAAAQADAAAVVRAAFAQAERLIRQAEASKVEADKVLLAAREEAERMLASVSAERDDLLSEARRDRIAAEEALLRARTEAEREASQILSRANELARREAEVLLEGARAELVRARDEATAIKAQAQREAEAIVAAATARARSTTADILAATRRRIGDIAPAVTPEPPATPAPPKPEEDAVVDLSDDRPPPAADAEYRGDWPKQPRPDDIDDWLEDAVKRAMARTFASKRRHRRPGGPGGTHR